MHTNRIDTCGNPIGEIDAGNHPASTDGYYWISWRDCVFSGPEVDEGLACFVMPSVNQSNPESLYSG